jgi:tRNA(adenine34) deaminase
MKTEYMQRALQLAELAQEKGEVPVGAVLVLNDEIIGEGYNQPISSCDPTAHAEIVALREAAKKIGNYRLLNTVMYVTLEPCAMCAAALAHARVETIVFGAYDYKGEKLNHGVQVEGGVLEGACSNLLKSFFKSKR